MNIISWNCNMAFRKKAEYIMPYAPDILIVPECENIHKLSFPEHDSQPTDMFWFGRNVSKGMAVFSFGKYKFEVLDEYNENYRMIVPIKVTGGAIDFILFAVWANNPEDKDGHYVTQVWKAVLEYDTILSEKLTILMGDFNSNTIWDFKKQRPGDHTSLAKLLEEKNIFSTYHYFHNQERGKESHPTLYLYRHQNKPYHIDYCFASKFFIDKLRSVEIGDFSTWSRYSDHSPLFVTFDF